MLPINKIQKIVIAFFCPFVKINLEDFVTAIFYAEILNQWRVLKNKYSNTFFEVFTD